MKESFLSFADLPLPWKSITDEQADANLQEAWAYWRRMYPEIAATVVQELEREMTAAHPLFQGECHLAAWDSFGRKDFAFLTHKPGAAVAVVHLTFYKETEAWLPATWFYASIREFVRDRLQVEERKQELRQRSRSTGAVSQGTGFNECQ